MNQWENKVYLQLQVAGEIVGAKDCRLEGDGESFGESFTIGVRWAKLVGDVLVPSSESQPAWISGKASSSFHSKLWRDSSTTRAKFCLSMVKIPFQMATESARITIIV